MATETRVISTKHVTEKGIVYPIVTVRLGELGVECKVLSAGRGVGEDDSPWSYCVTPRAGFGTLWVTQDQIIDPAVAHVFDGLKERP